jgi:hypothetical protein
MEGAASGSVCGEDQTSLRAREIENANAIHLVRSRILGNPPNELLEPKKFPLEIMKRKGSKCFWDKEFE